jgi:hypothetical protein
MTEDSDILKDEELQAHYKDESDNIPVFSAKISELCKYIWAGSLAFFYATLNSATGTAAGEFYQQNKHTIFAVAVCGSVGLICDYLQNVCALKHSDDLVDWIENTKNITRGQYNDHTKSVYSRLDDIFFWLKNISCIFAALFTAYSILNFVITH